MNSITGTVLRGRAAPVCSARTVLLMALLWSSTALAHRINVFAYVEGGQVHVEAYSAGGGKVRRAPVLIYGPQGALLARTVTNGDGKATFIPKAATDLRISVDTGEGHRAEYLLQAAELAGFSAKPEGPPHTRVQDNADVAAVRRELEALRKRVEGVRSDVAELRRSSGDVAVGDVLAGLAFILAVACFAALLLKRREASAAAGEEQTGGRGQCMDPTESR